MRGFKLLESDFGCALVSILFWIAVITVSVYKIMA